MTIGYTSRRLQIQYDSPLEKIPGRTPIISRRLVSFTTIHDAVHNHVLRITRASPGGFFKMHDHKLHPRAAGSESAFNKNINVQEALIYNNS